MGACFFALSVLFFIIGFIMLVAPERSDVPARPDRRTGRPTRTPPARTVAPVSRPLAPQRSGDTMIADPQTFNWIELGARILVPHPVQGEMQAHVMGRVRFAELWQRARGQENPWVPTGNAFLGFWLEGDLLLLSWLNRAYLLDERVALSDVEIKRTFAPHARKFAQSDQTADVYFAYPPAMWHIDDIGKFRVEEVAGEGLAMRPGGVGRFIHASGDGGRALVVEDYEGAGGQDTAWIGYQVEAADIKNTG